MPAKTSTTAPGLASISTPTCEELRREQPDVTNPVAPDERKRAFEQTHKRWIDEPNANFEKHGFWWDDLRVW